jgi:hypothetical protein
MVPGSKLKFEWDFCYDGQSYKVELKDSKLSRKKELLINGKTILPRKVHKNFFSQNFPLDKFSISFLEEIEGYELKINQISFKSLQLAEKKSKSGEIKNVEQVPDVVVEPEVTQTENKEEAKLEKEECCEKQEEIREGNGINLLSIEEKPTSIFPLKDEPISLNNQNINNALQFKKMQSAELPSKIGNLDDLFSHMTIPESKKEPCKAELVKNLYQRTFSSDACNNEMYRDEIMKKNENKVKEDNFYRGFLMNPYGQNSGFNFNQNNSSQGNWQFNKQPQYSNSTHNTNFTDETIMKNPSNNLNSFYPNLNEVPHPKRRSESNNNLLQFTPVERYQQAEKKTSQFGSLNNGEKKNEQFDEIVMQLFN